MRIDSGDLGVLAHQARDQLDALGATATRIVLSGDLDEHALAALATAPVDAYGVGTSVVTGSGAPTAGFVYKLVEVDGPGGRQAVRGQGHPRRPQDRGPAAPVERHGDRGGRPGPGRPRGQGRGPRGSRSRWSGTGDRSTYPRSADSRDHLAQVLTTLPWEGLALSKGDPAIPTVHEGPQ